MQVSAKQFFTALITMICTLGVLFGAQRLYQKTIVQSPLVATLGSIGGVRSAQMKNGTVTVKVKPGADLMSVYRAVYEAADARLGHPPTAIVFASHANSRLNAVSESASFMVAQGEATGQYIAMESNIQKLAASHGATARVELGTHHLYLTFRQGSSVLYQVVPVTIGGTSHAS
ncbi:hypothetical protein [Sulfobacillus harzensis]|uniref:Uncharacterized protein n=1 Tax=Sulfobacillus harzensis TaxID=2729629 RepID=A0A7Y0L041_9FIRM|nr:hypothetical protein [Sulfobacillus harzensis]NMP20811.1 hypothetical protein [Sulfobacillus harzensis]